MHNFMLINMISIKDNFLGIIHFQNQEENRNSPKLWKKLKDLSKNNL